MGQSEALSGLYLDRFVLLGLDLVHPILNVCVCVCVCVCLTLSFSLSLFVSVSVCAGGSRLQALLRLSRLS